MGPPVRFVADAMLGKLAKWLRILGCDTAYDPDLADGELAERAIREGRVVLTRDTLLIQRRAVRDNHFLVRAESCRDQLREVVDRFRIDPSGQPFTRCVRCNELLEGVPRRRAAGKVPPHVYDTREEFASCPGCGRIYWNATHRARMEKCLEALRPG